MAELHAHRHHIDERVRRAPGWVKASADEIADRDELAAGVIRVLHAAEDSDRERGYVIEVDLGDDAAGGVFLKWNPGGAVTDQASTAVLTRDFTHPAIKFHGEVSHAMTAAAVKVLRAAGFTPVLADDDMRPYELDIRSGSLDALAWLL